MTGNTPSELSTEVKPEVAAPADPTPLPRKILGRKDILDSEDLATEEVDVPEWGGQVIVRALSGVERDDYEAGFFVAGKTGEYNLQNLRAKLASRTIVDEDGKRIFSNADIVTLGLKSAAALDRVFAVAQKLSRLTKEDVKELANQLEKGQSDGSGSA